MLVVCTLDAVCVTRDGTTRLKGTALDRVLTNSDESDYAAGPGLGLMLGERSVNARN